MTTQEITKKYDGQIELVQASADFDDAAKRDLVKALTLSKENAIRANTATRDRIALKLFVAHYANGCPECQHYYRPNADEVDAQMLAKEINSVNIKI